MTYDKLFRSIKLWADGAFGRERDYKGILNHLDEEVDELRHAVEQYHKGFVDMDDVMYELADVQILLFNLAQRHGVCANRYLDAIAGKHLINTKRVWGKEDADGKIKHIEPTGDAAPATTTYYCVVCGKVPVDVYNGYDTCPDCAAKI